MSRTRAQTLLSRFPWTKSPLIVGAPMRVFSSPELALTISSAGGLGFIGPQASTKQSEPDLEEATLRFKQLQQQQQQQNLFSGTSTSLLPVGIGFQLWSDDLEIAAGLVRKHQPCAVWLYAPTDEKDYVPWVTALRSACPDTQIWIQIGTLGEVRRMLEVSSTDSQSQASSSSLQSSLPDVLIVQGSEAGGHGRATDGIGLTTLLPEVADLLSSHNITHIPLVAAGGIADGRGIAAALCLGADAISMGTRFLAATEARISLGYQREVVRATDGAVNTTRTLLYNHLRGTYGWPAQYAPRTIINRTWIEHQGGKGFDELKVLHDDAVKKGDQGWGPEGRLATYAGASIGLVKEVKGAAEIVQDVRKEALEILNRARDVASA